MVSALGALGLRSKDVGWVKGLGSKVRVPPYPCQCCGDKLESSEGLLKHSHDTRHGKCHRHHTRQQGDNAQPVS